MKKWNMLLLLIAGIFLLYACGNTPGKEYVGKWQDTKSEKVIMEIVHNKGNSFWIYHTSPSIFNGELETEKIPATYVDETLKFEFPLMSITLLIDQKTGLMSDGRREYKRI